MVLAHSDILVGVVDGSPLTYDDISGLNCLAAEFLETESFTL